MLRASSRFVVLGCDLFPGLGEPETQCNLEAILHLGTQARAVAPEYKLSGCMHRRYSNSSTSVPSYFTEYSVEITLSNPECTSRYPIHQWRISRSSACENRKLDRVTGARFSLVRQTAERRPTVLNQFTMHAEYCVEASCWVRESQRYDRISTREL